MIVGYGCDLSRERCVCISKVHEQYIRKFAVQTYQEGRTERVETMRLAEGKGSWLKTKEHLEVQLGQAREASCQPIVYGHQMTQSYKPAD